MPSTPEFQRLRRAERIRRQLCVWGCCPAPAAAWARRCAYHLDRRAEAKRDRTAARSS